MTYRSAMRYRWPNFSSSAITQSVTHGIPIRERIDSEMKVVSVKRLNNLVNRCGV